MARRRRRWRERQGRIVGGEEECKNEKEKEVRTLVPLEPATEQPKAKGKVKTKLRVT